MSGMARGILPACIAVRGQRSLVS